MLSVLLSVIVSIETDEKYRISLQLINVLNAKKKCTDEM